MFKCFLIIFPISKASNGGTAFPICLYWFLEDPSKKYQSGKDCILAASLGVMLLA